MKRLLFALGALSLSVSHVAAADLPFDFEVLQFRAKTLAAKPYESRPVRIPKSLQELTYDQYRDIRFEPNRSFWRRERLPFELQFFHPGFIYHKTVLVSEIVGGEEKPVEFSTKLFNYGNNRDLGDVPGDIGFTGFRVHYALNSPNYLDELVVFQGASYFRALGQGMRYGQSSRGLAINTAEEGGEEFPIFEEFWVQRPSAEAKEVVVYALLDSPSVAGAYRFTIRPGPATVMQIRSALYFRANAKVKSLGLAPLTSMFWFGENTTERHGDLRPEVHDTDGLQIERGNGEWVWRPLVNPNTVRVAQFSDENPKGFGLVQRDRAFSNHEDLEAFYHLRPSLWVEPIGSWGKGSVRLVEIPTPNETNDNIVAFWTPEKLPPAGEPLVFEYRLHWFMDNAPGAKRPPAGYVAATRQGFSKTHQPELRRFWVDFDGTYLRSRSGDGKIQAVVSVGAGAELVNQSLEKNPYNSTWRLAFSLKPDGSGRPVELRCFLKREPHILTETWSYLWNP